jgi:predicted nucleotidyltransferase
MTINEILKSKRAEIFRLATKHGARNLRLFGSVARGQSRPDSDIDLLIDLDPDRSLLDRIGLKHDLEDLLGRKVDVMTERSLHYYIRESVLKQAVAL